MHYRDALSGYIIGVHYERRIIPRTIVYGTFYRLFFLFIFSVFTVHYKNCLPSPRLYDIINLVGDIAQLGEHLLDV